jgi:hypothetical protein
MKRSTNKETNKETNKDTSDELSRVPQESATDPQYPIAKMQFNGALAVLERKMQQE